MAKNPAHFKGKGALEHVVEAQAQGIIDSVESHGSEIPGHIFAGADAARETALVFLVLWTILLPCMSSLSSNFIILGTFALGWLVWKTGKSAWIAWSRLERLNRIVAEEKWEIEHHRQQEREELKELYAAKGFEGKLLEEVLDVLMADGDRLLRVMIQEELGLTLEAYEHPLKQALGAAIGVFVGGAITSLGLLFPSPFGILIASLMVIGCSGALSAYHQKNKIVPAIVWNMAIGGLAFGTVYFLLQYSLAIRG